MTNDEQLILDPSETQARITELSAQLHQTQTELAERTAQLEQAQAQFALREKQDAVSALLGAYHPRDAQLLLRLLDLNQITLQNDEAQGLEAQMRALRERAPYLFADLPDSNGGSAAGGDAFIDFDMNAFLRGER